MSQMKHRLLPILLTLSLTLSFASCLGGGGEEETKESTSSTDATESHASLLQNAEVIALKGDKVQVADFIPSLPQGYQARFLTSPDTSSAKSVSVTIIVSKNGEDLSPLTATLHVYEVLGELTLVGKHPSTLSPYDYIRVGQMDKSRVQASFTGLDPASLSLPTGDNEVVHSLTVKVDGLEHSVKLKLMANDTTPPVFGDMGDIYIAVGDSISYKSYAKVSDNSGITPAITVDTSKVDRYTVGTYPVTYTATDASGNTASITIRIIVDQITTELVNGYIDELIVQLMTDDMTNDEKIKALWKYTLVEIPYSSASNHADLYRAAYIGLTSKTGDCYTVYAINKLVLDKLGIPNLEVRRLGGKSNHWWNLVQFDDGVWYHIDSTNPPREMAGQSIYKMTESKLAEYTEMVGGGREYYVYDHTLPQYAGLDIAK